MTAFIGRQKPVSYRVCITALCLGLSLLVSVTAAAAGPEKVATLERALWPEPISSGPAFDRASQAEILTFTRLFAATALTTEAEIRAFTGLTRVNLNSVQRWQAVTRQRLLQNYRLARGETDLSTDWPRLIEQSFQQAAVDKAYRPWQQASEMFHRRYLYEQVRLAALFPRITSEIDTFQPTHARANDGETEITGFELPDRQFMLSYDDGPSASRTAPLVTALENAGIKAYFFVLGENLAKVQPAAALYQNQCLASHGYQHKSHQKWSQWAESLADTRALLAAYTAQSGTAADGEGYAFRPPYGQRHQALVDDLTARGETIILWNIDSQDWNRKLSAQQVQDRVQTLMLLWRRGIILYHDIHPKAQANLPALLDFQQQAQLNWWHCNRRL